MIVSVSSKIVEQCREFSLKCAKTNLNEYKKRNQSNLTKIQEDIMIGKIGEWAVYKHLGKACSIPDMEIYTAKKKSFDCDLQFKNKRIHVKSQGIKSVNLYGNSWLLQRYDPLFTKPQDCDILYGTAVDGNKVEIVMIKPAKEIVFGETKVHQIRHTKVAIYLEEQK